MQSIWLTKILSLIEYAKDASNISDEHILGGFIYGSQNYNLSTVDSDVDIILLIKEGVYKSLRTPWGEEIKILNLNQFISHLKKGNLRCYEILFTNYQYINPSFNLFWEQFVEDFAKVMNYERIQNSLIKKIKEHYDYLLWIPNGKNGDYYCRKRLYWLLRSREQYEHIKNGMSFEQSLVHKNLIYADLDKIKTIEKFVSPNDICKIRNEFNQFLKNIQFYNATWTVEESAATKPLSAYNH